MRAPRGTCRRAAQSHPLRHVRGSLPRRAGGSRAPGSGTRSGFAGSHIEKQIYNQLEFGVEEIGSGEVIFMVDDPLFRDFWEGGKMLFANAVLMPF